MKLAKKENMASLASDNQSIQQKGCWVFILDDSGNCYATCTTQLTISINNVSRLASINAAAYVYV